MPEQVYSTAVKHNAMSKQINERWRRNVNINAVENEPHLAEKGNLIG